MTVKFSVFEKLENATYAQTMMKEGLKAAAGKGDVKFVAAKNYKIGGKMMSLFLVVEPAAQNQFLEHIKKQGSMVATSTGVAAITKGSGVSHKIVVKSAKGALSTNIISTIVKPAVGNDAAFEATTPEREKAEEQAKESELAKRPKPNAADMVKQSIKEAQTRTDIKFDRTSDGDKATKPNPNKTPVSPKAEKVRAQIQSGVKKDPTPMPAKGETFVPSDAVIADMAKAMRETAEYGKFAAAYEKLAVKYKFNTDIDYKKVPVNIWQALISSMAKSGYLTSKIPNVGGDTNKLIFATKGKDGQMVREELLEKSMIGMKAYIDHAEANLDKVVKAVLANKGTTWAFWSGIGAKQAAEREAGDGLVLEGSIGSWFSDVYRFEHLTGVNDMLLWNSMSELYARKAAEYYEKFNFIGYVGPGGSRDTTVWNNIEKPTLIEVLNVKKSVPVPPVKWFVVDCVADSKERSGWKPSGQPSKQFPNRTATIDEIKRRYTE